MALNKQAFPINFSQGLDLKTDDKQVQPGKFLALANSIFTKAGLLQKRNGYKALPALPDTSSILATTFSGNLTAIGESFNAFSSGREAWVNKGAFHPLELTTLPLIRSNLTQIQTDTAIAPNGLVCTVYSETGTGSTLYKYAVADSVTGQNIVAPTLLPNASGSPRVFLLGNYFVVVFTATISATAHLQYIAINTALPTSASAPADISTTYTPHTTVAFDGYVANNFLYLAWNGSDGGGAIRVASLSQSFVLSAAKVFTGHSATIISVTADLTPNSPVIWVSFYNSGTSTGYAFAVDSSLNTVLAQTQIISSGTVLNITSTAQNGIMAFLYEVSNAYSYDSGIQTNFIRSNTITQGGTLGSSIILVRSLGLASKAFLIGSEVYFVGIYNSLYQPSYFLMNGGGSVVSRFAYSNGGSYYTLGLPSVAVTGNLAQVSYFYKDLIQAVNKDQGVASAAGVYSQTGINLISFTIGGVPIITAEIGSNLNLTGGVVWVYDGYLPVEQNFFVWPDYIELTSATSGGHLADQEYFYQVTYEWSDNQGNVFRSSPSIPISITTSGGGNSTVTINVPTLRLTYKTANPVKIVVYRWSTAQQTYYQVTSITSPTLNSTTSDSVEITDTSADDSIIGNNILYPTGGVVEDIGPPSFIDVSLFKSRLFGIDSEDNNLLWYSKQVIEATPVEMSDLFTIYVAPTTGSQGSTGSLTCTAPMDDKLILFKKDAAYYIVGNGPDNTGASNDFSEPVFITSTVGCTNKSSIVFIPNGLMFQSDKGIWLLGRDLSTQYIGAPVEGFNQYLVESAVNIPGTNQVRFSLSNGTTLMYDYFYNQWGTFIGVPAISSTLYQGLHTFINSFGQVYQESPGSYLDGSSPVLMSFTTSWFHLAGLQGYERFYMFYLLGTYMSPHKLVLSVAYDYAPQGSQQVVISPQNFNASWGGDSSWGASTPWGGTPSLEQWKIHTQRQTCQAFQVTLNEVFDPTYGTVAGAGLTLSGLNLVIGLKKGYRPLGKALSAG